MKVCDEIGHINFAFGTATIVVILVAILEFVALCYALYHVGYLRKLNNRWLSSAVLCYHFLFFLFLVSECNFYFGMMVGNRSSPALVTASECRAELTFKYWLPFMYYNLLLLFLFLRLRIVFQDSVLELGRISKLVFSVTFILGFGVATAVLFLLAIGSINNFCASPHKIWDFFFFFDASDQSSILYPCDFNGFTAQMISLSLLGVYIIALMVALTCQFVVRLHRLIKQDKSDEWGGDQQLTHSFKKSCITGLAALLISLVSFIAPLSGFNTGLLIFYWDGFFNGILLISSFEFGDWIFQCMCKYCYPNATKDQVLSLFRQLPEVGEVGLTRI